jgi:hypothetical protein
MLDLYSQEVYGTDMGKIKELCCICGSTERLPDNTRCEKCDAPDMDDDSGLSMRDDYEYHRDLDAAHSLGDNREA